MEHVTSADGTRIAYERSGAGPPLVLVHGSLNDRNAWGAVAPAFRAQFTVFAMDRRGRGESGAPHEHELARQFEDVAAVIDAAGEPVDLIGHSYGARCALGAAAMIPERVKHLVLYEPPALSRDRVAVALNFESMDPKDAVAKFAERAIGLTPKEIAALRSTPFFDYLASFAATMPFEGRALLNDEFVPARFAALKMPALFLVGSLTKDLLGDVLRQLAPYMTQAEWYEFEGQGHGASFTAPQLFADVVLRFVGDK
ncbi:MAG TPA: alpha/beta hydrolase [Dehalococcoidia bacterium]